MVDFSKRRASLFDGVDADAFLIADLDRILPKEIDAVSLRYLTGYAGEGVLLVLPKEALLLTDGRYLESAQHEVPDLPLEPATFDYMDELASAIHARGIKRIAVAGWRISYSLVERLRGVTGIEVVALEDPVKALRAVKDTQEIALIREAIRISEESLTTLLDEIKIGMDETEVAFRLECIIREKGDGPPSFVGLSSGENTSIQHYRPGRRALKQGDFLLIDFGAQYKGYNADITRTFAVGEPSAKMQEIYDVVLRANCAGIEALQPETSGRLCDTAAREVVAASPYDESCFGPVGHGIGLEVHEAPVLSQRTTDILKPGMVVTVEPGIYIPGFGGVRIEDDVLVTDDGYEILTSFPKDRLIEVG